MKYTHNYYSVSAFIDMKTWNETILVLGFNSVFVLHVQNVRWYQTKSAFECVLHLFSLVLN